MSVSWPESWRGCEPLCVCLLMPWIWPPRSESPLNHPCLHSQLSSPFFTSSFSSPSAAATREHTKQGALSDRKPTKRDPLCSLLKAPHSHTHIYTHSQGSRVDLPDSSQDTLVIRQIKGQPQEVKGPWQGGVHLAGRPSLILSRQHGGTLSIWLLFLLWAGAWHASSMKVNTQPSLSTNRSSSFCVSTLFKSTDCITGHISPPCINTGNHTSSIITSIIKIEL